MFLFDCTMEDIRIIATEHRVPLDVEESAMEARRVAHIKESTGISCVPLMTKHDGTFDVLHVDGLIGQQHTINLTMEELAIVMHLGMVGDEGASHLYDTVQVKRYQELMKDNSKLSFIP